MARCGPRSFRAAFEELTAYAALLPTGELWKKSITSMVDQLFPDPGDRKALIPRLRDGLRTLHNQLRDDPEWESGRWEIEKLTAAIVGRINSRYRRVETQ